MYHRPRLPKVDKRYENCARRPIDGPLETSPVSNLEYFHQRDLPENISIIQLKVCQIY